jgi:hypothetical protein
MNSPAERPPTRISSRVALVDLDEASASIMSDCFRQFRIQAVPLKDDAENRLSTEKFEGCVVRLNTPHAEGLIKAARTSRSSRGMVLYGIADHKTAMQYSKYGINAVLGEPLERSAALKAVRGTYLLAVHEFRRYVRVPVAIKVEIDAEGRGFSTLSQEVSSGGMSLEVPAMMGEVKNVNAVFTLPGAKTVSMKCTVCWRRDGAKIFGIRFDPQDPARPVVREWIEKFLDSQPG